MAIERFSVVSQNEAMQTPNTNGVANAQEKPLVLVKPEDKSSKGARGLRLYGTFNVATGLAWGTAAVLTGGAVAAGAAVMAGIDGAQAVGSFAGARALDKKQQRQEEEGQNAGSTNDTDTQAEVYDLEKYRQERRTAPNGRDRRNFRTQNRSGRVLQAA